MYVSGHIHTDQHFTKALPNGAIVSEGTKWYIFVTDETAHNKEHEGEHHEMAFRMVEIVPGKQDEGFTEVNLVDSMPEHAKIVMN
jgi:cobalt-zinc-cadmium efflux system membrane fusion protein